MKVRPNTLLAFFPFRQSVHITDSLLRRFELALDELESSKVDPTKFSIDTRDAERLSRRPIYLSFNRIYPDPPLHSDPSPFPLDITLPFSNGLFVLVGFTSFPTFPFSAVIAHLISRPIFLSSFLPIHAVLLYYVDSSSRPSLMCHPSPISLSLSPSLSPVMLKTTTS